MCGSQPRREGDLVSSSWIIELFIRDLDKRALMPKQRMQRQKGLVRCNLKWNKIKALTMLTTWNEADQISHSAYSLGLSDARPISGIILRPELNLLYNWMMLYTIWNIIHARLAKHTSASFLLSRAHTCIGVRPWMWQILFSMLDHSAQQGLLDKPGSANNSKSKKTAQENYFFSFEMNLKARLFVKLSPLFNERPNCYYFACY